MVRVGIEDYHEPDANGHAPDANGNAPDANGNAVINGRPPSIVDEVRVI